MQRTSVSPDYFLDITQEVCPITFVRTKLLLERMTEGEVVEVRLNDGEPLINVPRSAAELGHLVIDRWQEDNSIHHILIRKGSTPAG